MSQQTEISQPLKAHKSAFVKPIKRMGHALKNYWPLVLLTQLPLIILSVFFLKAMKPLQNLPLTSAADLQSEQIKSLENHIKSLSEKILDIQNKYTAALSELKSQRNFQNQTLDSTSVAQSKNQILENLDRIGEKIRLNEPFAGLLARLPKESTAFPGYQTLYKYSSKLPLTFMQLKKIFDDIYKTYIPPKKATTVHPFLAKIASFFHGKIKVESTQNSVNPLLPVQEALDMQDLKTALSMANSIDFPTLKLWKNLAIERILLESDYSVFAEKMLDWLNQNFIDNTIQPAISSQKERNF